MSIDKTEIEKLLKYCKERFEQRIRNMKIDDLVNPPQQDRNSQ